MKGKNSNAILVRNQKWKNFIFVFLQEDNLATNDVDGKTDPLLFKSLVLKTSGSRTFLTNPRKNDRYMRSFALYTTCKERLHRRMFSRYDPNRV